MKLIIYLLPVVFLLGINSPVVLAQSPNAAYTIQQGDWLSKIADRAYDNPHLYYRIIEGTNQKAEADNTYRTITSANDIAN